MSGAKGAKPLVSRDARRRGVGVANGAEPSAASDGGGVNDGLGVVDAVATAETELNGEKSSRRMRRRLDLEGEPVKFGLRIHPKLLRAVDLASWDMDLGKSEFIERAVASYLVECGYSVPGFEPGAGSSVPG